MSVSNLGAEYLQIGEFSEGLASVKQSLALDPESSYAAANVSLALRYQEKYEQALPFARKAVQLNPAQDTNWLELADCLSCLRTHRGEARDAYLRAAKEAERHLLTDPSDGPSWMLLALYKVMSGTPQEAPLLMERAESQGARDMDSQLCKVRILELLGKREDALTTLAACSRKGATDLQFPPLPDLDSLRKDPRYRQLMRARTLTPATSELPPAKSL